MKKAGSYFKSLVTNRKKTAIAIGSLVGVGLVAASNPAVLASPGTIDMILGALSGLGLGGK